MGRNIAGTLLAQPPQAANQVSSSGHFLAAWRFFGKILDDDGQAYHFALHSTTNSWQAYRWDEQYGNPVGISVFSRKAIWVDTNLGQIMLLSVEDDGNVSVVARTKDYFAALLHANARDCFVQTEIGNVVHLQLDTDNHLKPVANFNFNTDLQAEWFCPMPDGGAATGNDSELVVITSSGKVVHEKMGRFNYHPPFIIRYDSDNLYYTDNPQREWRKTPIPQAHRNHSGNAEFDPVFFTVLGDTCYTFTQTGANVLLYRFCEKSPANVECVGEISSTYLMRSGSVAAHGGLICIAAGCPIPCDNTFWRVPRNKGFLAWDPIRETFYADIPRYASLAKRFAGNLPMHMGTVLRHGAGDSGQSTQSLS